MAIRAGAGIFLIAVMVGGCGQVARAPASSPAATPATTQGTTAPSAVPIDGQPSPSPTIDLPAAIGSPTAEDLDAIRFRTSFGLRADLTYVRYVAANPQASSFDFAVPLMPDEIAELRAREANAERVVGPVQAYAAGQPSEFAGLYVDQQHGDGAVTTMWTGHLAEHTAAIRALVGAVARVAFRSAMFTYRDLRALQDRVSGDWDWMRLQAIAPQGVGVDVIANTVRLEISSADPAAPARVTAHYAAAPGMLTVESDGTGAALIPGGLVKGRVVDSLGKPPGKALEGQLDLSWTSDGPGDCGGGDIGFGVAADGTFELPCQAGGHIIQVQIGVPDDGWKTLGEGHVVAVADSTVTLEIRLTTVWPTVAP